VLKRAQLFLHLKQGFKKANIAPQFSEHQNNHSIANSTCISWQYSADEIHFSERHFIEIMILSRIL
jgi:hypothetical protein